MRKDGRKTNIIRVDLTVKNANTGLPQLDPLCGVLNFQIPKICKIVSEAIPPTGGVTGLTESHGTNDA